MKLLDKINFTGIPAGVISAGIMFGLMYRIRGRPIGKSETLLIILVSFIISLYCFASNQMEKSRGKKRFGIFAAFSSKPDKFKAQGSDRESKYPEIPEVLTAKNPDDYWIFGKSKGKYVGLGMPTDGHILIIGGSGSGKSSCSIIPSTLALSARAASMLVVDIKGEISFKGIDLNKENVIVMDFEDRFSWGYDFLYELHEVEHPASDVITKVMRTISEALILKSPGEKDPFWRNSSLNLLTGLMIYYYKTKEINEFIEIIDEVMGRPVEEQINEVLNNAKQNSSEYRYLISFKGMKEETLASIYTQVGNSVSIFVNSSDVRFALLDNPNRFNPSYLNLPEHYKIFLKIEEHLLETYLNILLLILNQTKRVIELRPETSDYTYLVIDELSRVMSAAQWSAFPDLLRTARSRKCHVVAAIQTREGLECSFTDAQVTDMLGNFAYTLVLSANSPKTQKSVIDAAGKSLVKKVSWSGSGNSRKPNIAFEEKPIVSEKDLIELPMLNEAILISPFGYCRIKKCAYYKDAFFKKRAEEIRKANTELIDNKFYI